MGWELARAICQGPNPIVQVVYRRLCMYLGAYALINLCFLSYVIRWCVGCMKWVHYECVYLLLMCGVYVMAWCIHATDFLCCQCFTARKCVNWPFFSWWPVTGSCRQQQLYMVFRDRMWEVREEVQDSKRDEEEFATVYLHVCVWMLLCVHMLSW